MSDEPQPKVVVFGSLNMDVSIEADRMPVEGETIDGYGLCVSEGGKGANQAVASARMGAPTTMLGAIGRDEFGRQLRGSLEASGVDCSVLRESDNASTGVAVILRSGGDNRIVIEHGANHEISPEQVSAVLEEILNPGDVLLTQFECRLESVFRAIVCARELGAYVIANPSPAHDIPKDVLRSIDLLCLNQTECGAILGVAPKSDDSSVAALNDLRERGVKTPVITLGSRGSVALTETGPLFQRAYPVKVVDTTGAGDTFVGSLAALRAKGEDLAASLDFASKAAALATMKVGAQRAIPTAAEVERSFKGASHD